MSIELKTLDLPGTGHVEVNIRVSADIHITATTARRRASRLVASEISNLLYGGEPTLVIDKHICWRVPILLAYPNTGLVGQVGVLDVDVESGEVFVTPEKLEEIRNYAHYLAQRTASVATE